jgi:apolipoprotein N-acyltransferase
MSKPLRRETLIPLFHLAALLLSGGMLVLSFPTYDQAWLGWVGLVPLLLGIRRLRPWHAFIAGWLAGIVYFVGIFPWINEVRSAGILAIGLGHLYLGLYFGLFSAIMSLIVRRLSLPLLTAAPVWVAVEYLRSHFLFLAFPWALLGHTQYLNLPILQVASLSGAYGVSFLLVLANGAIADVIGQWIDGNRLKVSNRPVSIKYKPVYAGLMVFVVIAVSWGLGRWAISREVSGTPFSLAVVQGNIPQGMKWDPQFRDGIISKYERLSEEAARSNPQLIVWPETATPGFVLKDMALLKRMVAMIRRLGTHFLVGSAEYPKFGKAPLIREKSGNTALYFSPTGKVLGQYLKIRLLPLGEYIPYKGTIPWPRFIISPEKKNYLIPGTDSMVFNLGGTKFGVLICWENIFPDLSRRLAKKGAAFVVNISNEAWFGDSAEPYQMVSMGVFRAVENRIHMVRATNTGISCFIDPYGRVTGMVERGGETLFVEGVSVREIRLSRPGTFYTRYGDILAFGCIAFSLLIVVWSLLRGIRGALSHDTQTTGGDT